MIARKNTTKKRQKMSEDYYVRKSDVEHLIGQKIQHLKDNQRRGKGLQNSIVNLSALQLELDKLYCLKIKFKEQQSILKKEDES